MFTKMLIFLAVLTIAYGLYIDPLRIKGVQIKNRGEEKLWVHMTGETSFLLPPRQMASIAVNDTWSGEIIARSEQHEFKTYDRPFTEAKFSFGGINGEDLFSVSMKNGFNKAISIESSNPYKYCEPAGCNVNLNEICPPNHQVKDEQEKIIGCSEVTDFLPQQCSKVVTSEEDGKSKMSTCKSNTYVVSIG